MAHKPEQEIPPPPPDYDPIDDEVFGAFVQVLGARFTSWSDGAATLECPIGEAVINRQGVVHGGAMMTLLDTAAGYAGCFCPYPGRRRRALTLSFTCNFLAAASRGLMIVDARVTGGGRSVYFAEATVRHQDGRALASGSGAFKYRTGSDALYGTPRDA